jgi:low affinity Fe/Cu permease
MKEPFRHLAENAAHAVGSYWAFLIALLTIVVWALRDPTSTTLTPGSFSSTREQRSLRS